MKILHWNCQGLRSPLTIPHLKDIKRSYNPDIMLLVETKNVDTVVQDLAKDLGYKNFLVILANDSSGGAAFFWNDGVGLSFLGNPSLYNTDMCVQEGTNTFWLSYIYGNPVVKYRNRQRHSIISSENAGYFQNKPRLMLGDFNELKTRQDKRSRTA